MNIWMLKFCAATAATVVAGSALSAGAYRMLEKRFG